MKNDMNPKEMVEFLNKLALNQNDETRDKLLQVSVFLQTLYDMVNRWTRG